MPRALANARAKRQSMGFAEIVGYLAAACSTLSFVPQVVRVVRTRDTRAISRSAYLALCVGVGLWLIYGIALASPPIIIANALTLALASVVLLFKFRFG